jgi:hypothetical protein
MLANMHFALQYGYDIFCFEDLPTEVGNAMVIAAFIPIRFIQAEGITVSMECITQQHRHGAFITLKGHCHEKSDSNKHVGDAFGLQYEPLNFLIVPLKAVIFEKFPFNIKIKILSFAPL